MKVECHWAARALPAVALLMWLPAGAFAHTAEGAAGAGFLTGFRHPLGGLDHVLAMLAVGMWGAQLGTPAIWALPVAFPQVMALGGVAAILGLPLIGIGFVVKLPHGAKALRAAGSAIAAAGLFLTGQLLLR